MPLLAALPCPYARNAAMTKRDVVSHAEYVVSLPFRRRIPGTSWGICDRRAKWGITRTQTQCPYTTHGKQLRTYSVPTAIRRYSLHEAGQLTLLNEALIVDSAVIGEEKGEGWSAGVGVAWSGCM